MIKGIEARYKEGHGKSPAIITTVEGVDELIDDLLAGEDTFSTLAEAYSLDRGPSPSGYPGHQLLVGVKKSLNLGIVSYMDEDGNVSSVGSPETRVKPTYHFMWHMTEFFDHSEVPIPLVRQAVKEFLLSGGRRPSCVEWQPQD
ncbi:Imm1 family immunity protein [Kitasatospora sp. A2-31]|uniref:Imm1 family immunity protein n=1 Tax=Kitasatospora sp. A2-31 TaxID=2916414 RepID=UPI001EEEB57A|nr:Imm1 family immunity protein [Kitasatospora sp. A2-31]MCG6498838.1 Imm1 family immunity protein [Kitasatospora sp. A2-31]